MEKQRAMAWGLGELVLNGQAAQKLRGKQLGLSGRLLMK